MSSCSVLLGFGREHHLGFFANYLDYLVLKIDLYPGCYSLIARDIDVAPPLCV